uniref:Homologous recombination OB-fold protein OB-fold domain-containing protein n=1 Tax=Tanacetum cinerariifolium TaxID=118510 RepID=A0A6L2LWW1_TANCI|nr:hypothetical protein [Tanacetum cinerariifolium]
MDYVDEKSTRIIPGPAGIFQTGRIHKLRNFKDDPTQEYIRKLIDDVSEDDDFKRSPWVTTLEFINDGGETKGGCFGDIKSYLKNGKVEKVVAIITSCMPNVIGDMNVTLKDPSGIISDTIHYKVLLDDGYANDIKVGSSLILHREMARELRMIRLLTDLFHEMTDAVKDKTNVIEDVKELSVAASGSDSMAFLRILRDEDLDKAKDIMNIIKETKKHSREKYIYIAKVTFDRK